MLILNALEVMDGRVSHLMFTAFITEHFANGVKLSKRQQRKNVNFDPERNPPFILAAVKKGPYKLIKTPYRRISQCLSESRCFHTHFGTQFAYPNGSFAAQENNFYFLN